MSLQKLCTLPENVQRAAEVIAGLDRCFQVGFGRLGPEQNQALQSLVRICAGTPLAAPVATAVEALGRNEFVDRHFAVLATARASIQGAQYDALRAQAATALGRPLPQAAADTSTATKTEASGPIANWQESTRNWLMELALAGFGQLEYQTLAPFTATLEHLQGEPRTARLAALLTGFLNELLGSLPIAALPKLPLYRWADLWTRSMIGSLRAPAGDPAGSKVSGTLTILGVDLHQHGYFTSFDAYAALETEDATRVVRVTQSSYKVDVICNTEAWKCFPKETEPLLKAIGDQLALKVEGMTLLPTLDLCWDGKAKTGKASAFMDLAAKLLAPGTEESPPMPTVDPVDRHPIQLAEPVYLADYAVRSKGWDLELKDGGSLPLALGRLGGASEIGKGDLTGSKSLVGLLRFDGGRWAVQPLAVVGDGKKAAPVFTGQRVLQHRMPAKKGDVLAILQERASKLLRKKS
jgi:hypothetical protein